MAQAYANLRSLHAFYEHVRRVWRTWEDSGRLAEGSRFVEVTGGDHGLVLSAETIAREIVALAGDRGERLLTDRSTPAT